MKVIAGRVVGGKIELDTDLEEGTPFQLTVEDEEELIVALEDIRGGNFEDGRELLRELLGLTQR
ncbi:MAG TPA: hypothetical protein VGF28_05880 [Thermoanaerobaculia bacterium]|jgi:hypothetical protein